MIVAVGLFVGLTIFSEFHKPKAHDEFGRLLNEQVATPAPQIQRAPQVVTEGSIADQDHADPTLVQASIRTQYLGVEPNAITPAPAVPVESVPGPTAIDKAHATIVGDANGVTLAKTDTQTRGVLGGGIFKQQ